MVLSSLPRSGQISLREVTRAIASMFAAQDEVKVRYRIVAYRDFGGSVRPYAARIVIAPKSSEHPWPISSNPVIRAGALFLIEIPGELEDLATPAHWAAFLGLWRTLVGAPPMHVRLNELITLSRESTGGKRSPLPCWFFELSYQDDDTPSSGLPDGPFVEPKEGFFASDLGDAAADWLAMPWIRGNGPSDKRIELTIADQRAYFGALSLNENDLAVEVFRGARDPLLCTVIVQDYHGQRHKYFAPVTDALVTATIPLPARSLEIFLTNSAGFCFDSYYEDEHRRSRKPSLLSNAFSADGRSTLLQEALNRGEHERLEFKRWLPIDRARPKSFELLKTICAFANSGGGDLFIGVNDELEIVGCAKGLQELGKAYRTSGEQCRETYAQLVRRVVSEGISPMVPLTSEWLTPAGLDVLHLSVDQTGAVHHVVESNDTYIRRGGNSKKATPSDLAALLAASSSGTFSAKWAHLTR